MSDSGLSYVQAGVLLIAAGTLMLLMLVVSSFRLSSDTSSRADEIDRERQVRMTSRRVYIGLLNAESAQRGYVLTGEGIYLDSYNSAVADALAALPELNARVTHPDDKMRLVNIDKIVREKFAEMDKSIALVDAGRKEEAANQVKTNRGLRYMADLAADLEGITGRADQAIAEGLKELTRSAHRLSFTTALGSALLVAFAGLAFFIVATNTGRLVAARQSLQQLTDELEDRVKERTAALTEANEEIQRFAYIVSHDLRAPLVNIVGFTAELESASSKLASYFSKDGASEVDDAAAAAIATTDIPESVGFIRASSNRMDALIGAILKLSREGRREFKRERVQLDEVVETSLASLRHQIEEGGVSVEVQPSLPSLVSDKLAVSQIVGNILENAVKYLDPGRPGEIRISAEERGGRVKLRIADNGRGIAEHDRKRIFDLFRRAGKPDRPGEGIGLAHVRSLVRALGGDVTVESKLDEGSAFTVDLPKKMPNLST